MTDHARILADARGHLAYAANHSTTPAINLEHVRKLADALQEKLDADTEPQLVKLVREIHEAVTGPRSRVLEQVTRADVESGIADAELPPPPTGYGVRLTFADDTAEDIDNVESVQVYDKVTGKFPFGFMEVEQKLQADPGGNAVDSQHRAGFWNDEGVFTPFDFRQAPSSGW